MHAVSINNRLIRLLAAVLAISISACASGPRQVRGELPLVSVDSLTRHNGEITLLLAFRNVNDRAFPLNDIGIDMRLNEAKLVDTAHTPGIEISARSREVVRVRIPALAPGLAVLDQIAGGSPADEDRPGLVSAAWQLELTLIDERGRSRETEASGFLHPVPGQPGRFR
ncbi:MAG: hypothetical protein EA419_06325 [Wenzhouxiangella sp.]|nr:MAG: hypothetical protein EA419_06325 [Wenzhouxiangella sp.]